MDGTLSIARYFPHYNVNMNNYGKQGLVPCDFHKKMHNYNMALQHLHEAEGAFKE